MNDKPKFDPQKHHRRSIRLKGCDYSQSGAYFITFCLKDREYLFGKIADAEMHLNEAGWMTDKWWQKIPEKFPDIELGEYVIMPNHFHAIVINVGADPRVRPEDVDWNDRIINAENKILDARAVEQLLFGSKMHEGEHAGSPLHKIVQWFKTMSTNEYIRGVKQNGWPRFNGKLWQRNYFEHIVRSEKSFHRVAEYIYNNSANWGNDKFFVG